MKTVIVGAGYVGLVTAACLAEVGIQTWCVDRDGDRIDGLIQGISPIQEPELEELLASQHAQGRLHFATALGRAMQDADVVFIAVGTPESEDGAPDLDQVFAAAEAIGENLSDYAVVAMKSTVPVGTTRQVERVVRKETRAPFDMVSNPEFLREGSAVLDCMRPDRILVGTESERARAVMRKLYRPFRLAGIPIMECSPETAELSKHAANSFLATKVAFINEVADLCEVAQADVADVARVLGADPRIGPNYMRPGPGFGGSCLPKDTKAFARCASDFGVPQRIVEAVIDSDAQRKENLLERVRRAGIGSLSEKRVAVLGLTFKAQTDDVRESPALVLVPALARDARRVTVHDPSGYEAFRAALDGVDVEYCDSVESAVDGVDIVVLHTDWPSYRDLDLATLKRLMRGNVLVDLRNQYDPLAVAEAGFAYHGVGRLPNAIAAPETPAYAQAAE